MFLKASGRAIERALQIGVYFQDEDDCKVRIEMGSVQAIDDIQIPRIKKKSDGEDEEMEGNEEGNGAPAAGEKEKKKKGAKAWKEEDIPETRMRSLSCVTVVVGLK